MTMTSDLPALFGSRWGMRRFDISDLSTLDRVRIALALLEMRKCILQIAEADITQLEKEDWKGLQARCKDAVLDFDRVYGSCLGDEQGPVRRRHLLLDLAVRCVKCTTILRHALHNLLPSIPLLSTSSNSTLRGEAE